MSATVVIALPPRTPWSAEFPEVVIHTTVAARDAHPVYHAAKAGDADAGLRLALDLLQPAAIGALLQIVGKRTPILLPVTAIEVYGFNAIPDGMTQVLCTSLGWPRDENRIVQNNKVGHTRAKAFNRIMTPATFEGTVERGAEYVLIDDHVGLGGTLANLKGHIETNGGRVIAMTTLTESRNGRNIALRPDTLAVIREKHGEDLEDLWQQRAWPRRRLPYRDRRTTSLS